MRRDAEGERWRGLCGERGNGEGEENVEGRGWMRAIWAGSILSVCGHQKVDNLFFTIIATKMIHGKIFPP